MVSLCTRYLSLDQAGLVDELVASKELATVEAIGEAELRAAVQELDRSTTIINKQTEALRQHHNALAKLADSNARSTESRREMEATRASRRAAERRALGSKILACLGYLLDNINRLEARVVAVQSYQAAAATLIDTAKAELAVPAVAATPKKAHPVQPASPTRARVPTSTPGPPAWRAAVKMEKCGFTVSKLTCLFSRSTAPRPDLPGRLVFYIRQNNIFDLGFE
ncbi:hypothetical protein HYQ45_018922 [Verticillium longisporum]|uniref:Uncharacterized protein n=1 Tax=Verticillium longisporum TaxID=100787 RepID=A0A8I2ZN62_VERLO|nr:hypothetical protein HYQ45_018922 [Verticillium longisporum]